MLSITKLQSGRLARLILEHCRDVRQYELRAATSFPPGIEPPCVAVIDLDELPRDTVGDGYSTQLDLYGLTCLLMLFDIHVVYLFKRSGATWINFADAVTFNLILCLYAVLCGDGTLTLAQRSDTPTPGCVVLLDQDFTVILNGSQSVVEAIAESSFNLSHPNSVYRLCLGVEDRGQDSPYDLLEALREAAYSIISASCWLLFRPSTTLGVLAPLVAVSIIGGFLQRSLPEHFTPLQEAWFFVKGVFSRCLPPALFVMTYALAMVEISISPLPWQRDFHFFTVVLLVLFMALYRTRNYPIRSGKFLDALGHPHVRKWQFDTLAAAATFQCLVLCHGIARPVESIDVSAFLNMLIPDERDVQEAWKKRVADRIVREVDICFAPTIPTFGDERQQQLKDLLDQAQLGDCTYRRSYIQPVP